MYTSIAQGTPKGMIEVRYTRKADNLTVDVALAEGVTGELVWKGVAVILRPGSQHLTLPSK